LLNSPFYNENIPYFNGQNHHPLSRGINYNEEMQEAMRRSLNGMDGNNNIGNGRNNNRNNIRTVPNNIRSVQNDIRSDDELKKALSLSMIDNNVREVPMGGEPINDRLEGDIDEETLLALQNSMLETKINNPVLGNDKNENIDEVIKMSIEEQERRNRLDQIKEQDSLYQESLQKDRERERLKQEELEQKEREIIENTKNVSEEEARLLAKEIRLRSIKIQDEPAPGVNVINIKFVLPSGASITRKFKTTDQLRVLADFIETRNLNENGGLLIPEKFLFVSDFPREEYRDFRKTLQELNIKKKMFC